MEKFYRKLNNKGFTLVELLAVIVILALIMVIAIPNVLNTVNSSKLSTLHSKAKSIVETFSSAYASDQLLPNQFDDPNAILKTIGSSGVSKINNTWTCIGAIPNFSTWAELSASDFILNGSIPAASPTTATKTTCSAIKRDAAGKIYVVLVAAKNGKFVSNNKVTFAYSGARNGVQTTNNY